MTDDQIREIWLQETGYAEEAAPFAILDFARALLATTAPTVEKEASPVATGDRLTDTKANDIIARDGYKWTGVVLMNEHGDRCIVELSAVRWLNKEAMWRLMHPDASPAVGDSASQAEPASDCDPGDICAGCRCRYNTYANVEQPAPPAQTADVRAMADEQKHAIEQGVGLLWALGKRDEAKALRALLEQKP